MKKIVFKNDKYKRAREGRTRLLEIKCFIYQAHICFYQKDGPGNLRRMYIDRIFQPEVSIKSKNFTCPNGHTLGIKIIYEKEKRPTFRLFVDAVMKKIVKAN